MSSSKILFLLCLSFIAGIFFESVIKIPQIFIWGFLFLAIVLILFSLLRKNLIVFGFCILFLAMGILRVQISEFNVANDKLSQFNGKGQIVLTGVVADDPDVRDTYQKFKVKVGDSTVLVTTKRYPEYKYLDKIKLTGKLEMPSVTEDFNYKDYLMKDGIYSVMGFPKIEVVGKASGGFVSAIYTRILAVKHGLRDNIQSNFSPPQSSILEGTILGSNGAMSIDLKNKDFRFSVYIKQLSK
jgi:hypothetical protein